MSYQRSFWTPSSVSRCHPAPFSIPPPAEALLPAGPSLIARNVADRGLLALETRCSDLTILYAEISLRDATQARALVQSLRECPILGGLIKKLIVD